MIEIHGKRVVVISGRCFAVTKDLDLASRVANNSQGRSNYQRAVSNIPAPRLRGTRSIKG